MLQMSSELFNVKEIKFLAAASRSVVKKRPSLGSLLLSLSPSLCLSLSLFVLIKNGFQPSISVPCCYSRIMVLIFGYELACWIAALYTLYEFVCS